MPLPNPNSSVSTAVGNAAGNAVGMLEWMVGSKDGSGEGRKEMVRKPTRIYRLEPGLGWVTICAGAGHHKTIIGLLHRIPSLGAGAGPGPPGQPRRTTARRGIDSISLNLHTSLAL